LDLFTRFAFPYLKQIAAGVKSGLRELGASLSEHHRAPRQHITMLEQHNTASYSFTQHRAASYSVAQQLHSKGIAPVPMTVFAKGASYGLEMLAKDTEYDCLAIDW
jgi:uroporphyrinogen-III decarboxylase